MIEVVYSVGELSLWLALMLCVWGALAASLARGSTREPLVSSARRAATAAAVLTVASAGALVTALLRQDFSFALVAATTSVSLPAPFRISALWSGQRGGMVLWAVAMATTAAIALRYSVDRRSRAERPALVTLASTAALLVGIAAVIGRPYSRLEWPVAEGLGMPWELQHPGAAVEPVLLTAGMAALVVGLALVVIHHFAKGDGERPEWPRGWFLAAWLLISAGLFVEAWSTYSELGWGEYSRRTEIGGLIALPWGLAAFGSLAHLRRAPQDRLHSSRPMLMAMVTALLLVAGGFAAWQFRRDGGYVMTAGQTERFADGYGREWEIASLGISADRTPVAETESVALEVSRAGREPVLLRADLRTQLDARGEPIGGPFAVPALYRGIRGDLLAAVDDVLEDRALVRVRFVPLSVLFWAGGALFLLTQLFALMAVVGRRSSG